MVQYRKSEVAVMRKIPHLKEKCILLAFFSAGVAISWLLQRPCPWLSLFHIPCPGCGMTRAWVCALRLNFGGAFGMHPMFWSVPVMLLWWLLDGQIFRRKLWNLLIPSVIGAGFVINWLCQLI